MIVVFNLLSEPLILNKIQKLLGSLTFNGGALVEMCSEKYNFNIFNI